MQQFNWNDAKNQQLKAERNVSFEEIGEAIKSGGLLDITKHPNQERYPNQKIFVVSFNDYVYIVPFVESEEAIFLKTIIPSRKMKKLYLGRWSYVELR